jgi:hypothetical protein
MLTHTSHAVLFHVLLLLLQQWLTWHLSWRCVLPSLCLVGC